LIPQDYTPAATLLACSKGDFAIFTQCTLINVIWQMPSKDLFLFCRSSQNLISSLFTIIIIIIIIIGNFQRNSFKASESGFAGIQKAKY